jgi:hypothetical protein
LLSLVERLPGKKNFGRKNLKSNHPVGVWILFKGKYSLYFYQPANYGVVGRIWKFVNSSKAHFIKAKGVIIRIVF